jgi:Ca2+:H+ antiporter
MRQQHWIAIPLLSLGALVVAWGTKPMGGAALLLALFLGAAVLSSVHHAEILAHRFGEPFGSLTLAVAVTAIEVALIVTLTLGGGAGTESLARDTVFAAFIIATNAMVGAALLARTLRGGVAEFNAEGTGAMLATLTALATLSLILPNFTSSSPGPTFSTGQLVFAAMSSLSLYLLFVFVQTVRHREQYAAVGRSAPGMSHEDDNDPVPSNSAAMSSFGLLLVSLVAVVGLAKVVSPAMERAILEAGLPITTVGVIIAMLILMPEGISAVHAARADDVQRSFNLAYGSAMASIGLTIPAIAIVSIVFDRQLLLGLEPTGVLLAALTVVVSVLTVTPGRATLLQAGVHLTIAAAFITLAVLP